MGEHSAVLRGVPEGELLREGLGSGWEAEFFACGGLDGSQLLLFGVVMVVVMAIFSILCVGSNVSAGDDAVVVGLLHEEEQEDEGCSSEDCGPVEHPLPALSFRYKARDDRGKVIASQGAKAYMLRPVPL